MPEPISEKEVAHVAHLARLRLSDEELRRFTSQLSAVLDHAKDVEALHLEGVEPMAHPLPLENVTRKDEIHEMVERDSILAQAPAVEDGRFKVPKILGEEP
ncbi:MAG: Asp-tRNA(Asn)/Glu-tRNA(Gln) amidotransferase subunit GatC [Actinomycetota bacterium]|nr:Asp-tRNA(Asn)/Glu-tRNA(Gln) amidotransferase subunit GatC [Actinomycetota bacterium]MEC8974914.1 Asp-tRNA(Asn)/Glu-tRNA(Gln) amidotransferase subunit GatC [Actinomycetota bacterium]